MNTYPPGDEDHIEHVTPDAVYPASDAGNEAAPPPPQMVRPGLPLHPVVLTWAFLIINVVVFVVDVQSGFQLTILGLRDNAALASGDLWRLITPMFLHGSVLHISLNSWFLYVVGRQLERPLGTLRFAMVYVIAGVAGVLAGYAFSQYRSLGASGALFGVMGALLIFIYRNQKILRNSRQSLMQVLQVIGINIVLGLLISNIDNWGHIGGLIGGIAMGWFAVPLYEVKRDYRMMPSVVDSSNRVLAWLALGGCLLVLAALYLGITAVKYGAIY